MENVENKYLSVSALNKYIAYKLETDIALKTIYIRGEVSNLRISKGHVYFVLKDDESEISAIIFNNIAVKLTFIPKDGMKVLIAGSVTPYMKKGSYNLIVNQIKEYGQGLIYQRFLELKEKLTKEGLFAPEHKKNIPEYSKRIGVITSETGDAFHDISSTISKRFPIAHIYLYPALVQGTSAPASIIKALKKAEYDNLVDVLIIARGGGSIEDLDCFNDEALARAIYASGIPIVSGVGHENDFTICDFVSDDRAPTPTGAAVRVTPDKQNILVFLKGYQEKLKSAYFKYVEKKQNELDLLLNNHYLKSFTSYLDDRAKDLALIISRLLASSPKQMVEHNETLLKSLEERIKTYNINKHIIDLDDSINNILKNIGDSYKRYLVRKEENLSYLIDKLILVNPLNIMKKGYTLIYKDNILLTSKEEAKENDKLMIHFHDGTIKVLVTNNERKE